MHIHIGAISDVVTLALHEMDHAAFPTAIEEMTGSLTDIKIVRPIERNLRSRRVSRTVESVERFATGIARPVIISLISGYRSLEEISRLPRVVADHEYNVRLLSRSSAGEFSEINPADP